MRVAVVGAGIAGLQAARRLDAAGWAVRLFDKSRGAGGRLSTRRTEQGAFDHGAQYLTARDPRFLRQVEAWIEDGVVARWEARCVRFTERGPEAEPSDEPRYVGLPGMSGIARALRGELPSELATRIERAERHAGRWSLCAESGARFEDFDALVVAVPAPQAVPLLDASPELEAIARGAGMLPCHAVMAAFGERVAVDFDAASFDRGPLAWAARNATKPGRTGGECWVFHSSAEWSTAQVEAAPETVQRSLLGAFREATGVALPEPGLLATHRWLYARPAAPNLQRQWDPERAVGICGDWLAGARVEDAFLSGERLADAMLGARDGR